MGLNRKTLTLSWALAMTALTGSSWPAQGAVSVREHGAVGDGVADDSEAFRRALATAEGELFVPAGTYRLGDVAIPEGTLVRGVGVKSVIRMAPDCDAALQPGNDCRLTDLQFRGDAADTASPIEKGIVRLGSVRGVTLDHLTFESSPRAGILTDHARNFRIADCRFTGVAIAIHLVFSDHGIVSGNFVRDAQTHGIQFWGNWQFERKECSDLLFTGNHVRNAGGGGIWGTGAVRVTMTGNVVDGAGDVGLDLEWCDDSTITGNTVRGAVNAGISLFYACRNVTIAGNSVVVTEGKEGRRDGIWLTDPNRATFPGDHGHRLVAITGNTVLAEGQQKRHGVYIGLDSEDVALAGNVFSNADVLDRTGRLVDPEHAADLRATTTVVPLSQEWRFQTDPEDVGIAQQWFAPDLDDSGWATVRSDTHTGWWMQGFKDYVGLAWYRALLPPRPAERRKHAYLHFGSVDEQAWIYLNGKLVCDHSCAATSLNVMAIWTTPFSADVTESLRPDGENLVAVRVQNDALEGGIYLPVHLVFSDAPLEEAQQAEAIQWAARDREQGKG